MDREAFRRHGHALVDWMADYLDGIEDFPVWAQTKPGEIAAALADEPPQEGEDFAAIFEDFKRVVPPGITHWQHPAHFAYFPANSSPPSVLAEMLTATFGVNAMLWQTSPAATEMETKLLDWLRAMIGLPEGFAGVIQSTASEATLVALIVARERASGGRINEKGWAAAQEPLAVYVSQEAHSSVEKGAKIAGYGACMVRKIAVDERFAMRADALAEAIAADRDAGITPTAVVATLGTTGTGGMDPLAQIAQIATDEGLYLHVDAAWAGSAFILPEQRHVLAGVERADSFVFNPHKWLMTNFDCSAHYVRDPDELIGALSILPEYLKSARADDVIDYRDWGVPLGRRFRALKLWFVIRSYGVRGLQAIILRHLELARLAHDRLAAQADFEITSPLSLALFSFRHRPKDLKDDALDAHNEKLLDALNDSGKAYFTQNRVEGRYVIRFSVGARTTEERHVAAAVDLITRTARGLPTG